VSKTSDAQLRAQAKYQKKPAQIKKREARNRARYKMMKAGKVKKGDGKDVDHIHRVGAGNGAKNLRVISASKNRKRNFR
jgi:hypothetical protein